jgi:hypothetical protein
MVGRVDRRGRWRSTKSMARSMPELYDTLRLANIEFSLVSSTCLQAAAADNSVSFTDRCARHFRI